MRGGAGVLFNPQTPSERWCAAESNPRPVEGSRSPLCHRAAFRQPVGSQTVSDNP